MVHTFVLWHCLQSDLVIFFLCIANWILFLSLLSTEQEIAYNHTILLFSNFRWLRTEEDISRTRITIVCLLLLLDLGSSVGGHVIQSTWNSVAVEVSANGSATKIGTWLIVWWGGYNRLIGFAFRGVEIYVRVLNS